MSRVAFLPPQDPPDTSTLWGKIKALASDPTTSMASPLGMAKILPFGGKAIGGNKIAHLIEKLSGKAGDKVVDIFRKSSTPNLKTISPGGKFGEMSNARQVKDVPTVKDLFDAYSNLLRNHPIMQTEGIKSKLVLLKENLNGIERNFESVMNRTIYDTMLDAYTEMKLIKNPDSVEGLEAFKNLLDRFWEPPLANQ